MLNKERGFYMKRLLGFAMMVLLSLSLTGCASCNRMVKDWKSETSGGLDRTINIYSLDGKLITSHTGKIDIEDRENSILFELNGKRYVYYNSIIEVIEK